MIEVGTITATDVPLATTGAMPRTTTIAGTRITPPPIPSMPARVPATTPTPTSSNAMVTVRSARPSDSLLSNSRVAVASTVMTKTMMSTFFGTTRNRWVPMIAPAIAPIDRKHATGQSMLPWTR